MRNVTVWVGIVGQSYEYVKGRGWNDGPGMVQEREALHIDDARPYLLDENITFPMPVNLQDRQELLDGKNPQAIREQALKKLTEEEKRVLGL